MPMQTTCMWIGLSFNLMLEFVEIQRESVAEYRTFVDKLDLVGEDKTSIFIYENEVFG